MDCKKIRKLLSWSVKKIRQRVPLAGDYAPASQDDVAAVWGTSRQAISLLENEKVSIDLEKLGEYLGLYGIEVDVIISPQCTAQDNGYDYLMRAAICEAINRDLIDLPPAEIKQIMDIIKNRK